LGSLTGTRITITAQHPIEAVEHFEPFAIDHVSWRAPWGQEVFQTITSTVFGELMSLFAEFHGCVADINGSSVVIRDQTPDEIRNCVRKYLAEKWGYYFSEYSLQPTAASEFVPYLKASGGSLLARSLSALAALNQKVGRKELVELLMSWPECQKDSWEGLVMQKIVRNLILAGDDEVIPYIVKNYETKDALSLLGSLHTLKAAETQRLLINEAKTRHPGKYMPIFRDGNINVNQKPANVTDADLHDIQALALDCINCLMETSKDEYHATANLTISHDGLSAEYRLFCESSHSESGLTKGHKYVIEFERSQNTWFIINYQQEQYEGVVETTMIDLIQ
jgi:hypothetical protein